MQDSVELNTTFRASFQISTSSEPHYLIVIVDFGDNYFIMYKCHEDSLSWLIETINDEIKRYHELTERLLICNNIKVHING